MIKVLKRSVQPWLNKTTKKFDKDFRKKLKKYVLPASAATVLLLIVLAIANAGAINHQLHSWKLLPEPERLTELYYENHTALPNSYTPGVPQSFSFTVHNLEYRDMRYDYQVVQTSEDGKQSQTLASGHFDLPQDAYRTVPTTITPADLGPRTQITTVISPQESIHYWVTNKLGTQ